MKKRFYYFFSLLIFLVTTYSCASHKVSFYAFGDIPYSKEQKQSLEKGIEVINTDPTHKFIIHLGDIKSGSNRCSEKYYANIDSILHRANKPFFIIPGDNETNDCSDFRKGEQLWNEYFSNRTQKANFVQIFYDDRRTENFSFISDRILFIGLNLVGGKVHNEKEWTSRLQDNIEFVFNQVNEFRKVNAMVIFGHVNPGDKNKADKAGKKLTEKYFFSELKNVVIDFQKPVLYLHGDGHYYYKNSFLTDNMTRVMVNGGTEPNWLLKISVNPKVDSTFVIQKISLDE